MLNGQYCLIDNKIIRDKHLPMESFKSILPYMEKNKIACEFLEIDYTYSNLINDRVIELRKFLGNTVSNFPFKKILLVLRVKKHTSYVHM